MSYHDHVEKILKNIPSSGTGVMKKLRPTSGCNIILFGKNNKKVELHSINGFLSMPKKGIANRSNIYVKKLFEHVRNINGE